MFLNLGVGPFPIHPQSIEVMNRCAPLDQWTLVDLYVTDPKIKQWDATKLDEVPDESVDVILASHLLEHIEHALVPNVLRIWNRKLKKGGKLLINVPNLIYACRLVSRYESGNPMDGYYNRFDGEHGLLSILYGSQSHPGEYHKAGFTKSYLKELLQTTGYSRVMVFEDFDAHDMSVLLAECEK